MDDRRLWAAADGVVTRVDTIDEPRFLGTRALRIVTFLSLFDVHINRVPSRGTVAYREYIPGAFRAAWDAEADEVNERNYLGFETQQGRVLMIQIAGLVARRIVCHIVPGDAVQAGERMGMIKFGSRTDVIVPEGMARSLVVPGMHVTAGITPIGEWL
jgi:phosphatidylserine decarboxylase